MNEFRKAQVALAGVVGQVVAAGVLHGTAQAWAQIVLAVVTAAGVYAVPNTTHP